MKRKKTFEAYPEEMLEACRKGQPCKYGVCDECPNIVGKTNEEENEEDE